MLLAIACQVQVKWEIDWPLKDEKIINGEKWDKKRYILDRMPMSIICCKEINERYRE
jgi:hypothetical protein